MNLIKKVLFTIPALAILGVAMPAHAVVPPAECTGTYTTTITVSANAKKVSGTAGNDLIYITGNQNSVTGLGGDDCISVSGRLNSVMGGAGNDVILDSGDHNALKGEADNDYLSGGTYDSVDGGLNIDTCIVDANNSSRKNCEL